MKNESNCTIAEAAPVPASTGRDENLALVIARLEQMADAGLRDVRAMAAEALVCAHALESPVAARELDADAERRATIDGPEFEKALHAYVLGLTSSENVRKYASAKSEFIGFIDSWGKSLAARATAESAPASAAPSLREIEFDGPDDPHLAKLHGCGLSGEHFGACPACVRASAACACRACNPHMVGSMMFICPDCGDKRCPNAADHRAGCPERAPSNSPVGAKEQDK